MRHPPRGRLPLLFARPAVTFPATQRYPLAGSRLSCLVTEAYRCEQLAQNCYAAFALSKIWTHYLLITSLLTHCTTYIATIASSIPSFCLSSILDSIPFNFTPHMQLNMLSFGYFVVGFQFLIICYKTKDKPILQFCCTQIKKHQAYSPFVQLYRQSNQAYNRTKQNL